jgi:hypothetical protein
MDNTKSFSNTFDESLNRMSERLADLKATAPLNRTLLGRSLSLEGLTPDENLSLGQMEKRIYGVISQEAQEMGDMSPITRVANEAATRGFMMSQNPRKALTKQIEFPTMGTNDTMRAGALSGAGFERAYSHENYDDTANDRMSVYTVEFNRSAPRQPQFAELFFPVFLLGAGESGYNIVINQMLIQNRVQRGLEASADDWKRTNLIRAIRNPKLLAGTPLTLVPVHNETWAKYFVDSTLLAPSDAMLNGEAIKTSYLATGERADLIRISQTPHMLATGVANETDSLDTAAVLDRLLLKFGSDLISLRASGYGTSSYTYAQQGDTRQMNVLFKTVSMPLSIETKTVTGGELVTLAKLKTMDLIATLRVVASGDISLRSSISTLYHNEVSLVSLHDRSGTEIPTTTGVGAELATAINTGKIIGYLPKTQRSNRNMRMVGLQHDSATSREFHPVPLKAPMWFRRPQLRDGEVSDHTDIQTLITSTHISMGLAALDTIQDLHAALKELRGIDTGGDTGPSSIGSGRWFVKPTLIDETIDVSVAVASLNSTDRLSDIAALLTNHLTNAALQLYVDSEYKAMLEYMYGPTHPRPCLAVVAPPYVANYLMISGDTRTIGTEFDLRVATTIIKEMDNRMYFSFVIMGEDRNTRPNVCNFGTLALAPEIVSNYVATREGTINNELLVTPRYQHYVNLPILGHFNITGIEASLDAVPFHIKQD